MSLFGRTAPAPAAPTAPTADRCEACRRPSVDILSLMWRVPTGDYSLLCQDPVDCRRHWPAGDRAACARAGGPR